MRNIPAEFSRVCQMPYSLKKKKDLLFMLGAVSKNTAKQALNSYSFCSLMQIGVLLKSLPKKPIENINGNGDAV